MVTLDLDKQFRKVRQQLGYEGRKVHGSQQSNRTERRLGAYLLRRVWREQARALRDSLGLKG